MAVRQVRIKGDPILRKKSRPVKKVTERTKILLDDMIETMDIEDGVGLAAPQVGILRRIIVVDPRDGTGPIKAINPEIIDEEGKEIGIEGCLSVPNLAGKVERPEKVRVRYMDENEEEHEIEAEGLLATIFCHEIDHLDGILYTDKVKEYVELEPEDLE